LFFLSWGEIPSPPSDSLTAAEGYKSLDFEQSPIKKNLYKLNGFLLLLGLKVLAY
jgi:aminoglycoside N3'-acetyltransferase